MSTNPRCHALIGMVLVIAALSGCGGGVGINNNWYKDIHTGTDGLVMTFVTDAPPKEVYAGSQVPIGLKIENKGATDIRAGIVSLGLEGDFMKLNSWNKGGSGSAVSFNLEGKSRGLPRGSEDILMAYTEIRSLDPQREEHAVKVYANACYNYQTVAIQEVCIDTNLYGQNPAETACEKKDVSLASQGAPLALTKIETRYSQVSDSYMALQFILHLQNKGKGIVTAKDKALKVCSSAGITKNDMNLVLVTASLDDVPLHCNKNTIKVEDSEMIIVCSADQDFELASPNYVALISVIMDYGYMETIDTDLRIKRVG